MSNIGVVGAGAFGTALATVLANNGHSVILWGRNKDHVFEMNRSQTNTKYLPGIVLPNSLKATNKLADLINVDVVLTVVPAQTTRAVLDNAELKKIQCPILMCAKGIELETSLTQTEIAQQVLPSHACGVISGPGFAQEIASGKPTALTLGFENPTLGTQLQHMLSTPSLRLYLTSDVNGTELGGALKNVYAIACGIVSGAALGESAQAALLTRGFAELTRLASHMGAATETLVGLSGFGDLVLSCTSKQSRNFAFGYQVGARSDFGQTKTVEGISTALAIGRLAERYNLEMPICQAVSDVLQRTTTVPDALQNLMSRPLKQEV